MANRTVSVSLKLLVGDYVGAAEKAATSTDGIGESAKGAGEKYRAGSRAIVAGAGIAAAAGTLAFGKIVSASMDFGKSMSNVQAVSGATGDQLKALSDAAIQAGADTAFSATQAADAEAELAKAGVSTSDILGGGLSGALSLAAAGQLDLGNAATIAANAMNIFGLSGKDVGHIADVLAAGANKSAADVDQLAQAMSQGGQVASSLGLGLEDTVGVLAMFADAGLKGSDAGTSLKTMLQALAAPSSTAAAMMEKLGINAFDAGGNFVGMEKFAGILQQRLGGLTQEQRANALATIFGSDAVRVANILFKEGAGGVKEYTTAVNDQGAAAKNAAAQQDNLAGDLEKLSGSIDTALIKAGSGANTVLRGLAQGAGAAVDQFSSLPGPLQAAATGILAIGTGGSGALALFGTIAPKIRSARAELEAMGRVGSIANTALGIGGKVIASSIPVLGLAAAAIEVFNRKKQESAQRVRDLTDAILADNGALGENTRQHVTNTLQQQGALEAARTLGLNLKDVTDAALGNSDALGRVNSVVSDVQGQYEQYVGSGQAVDQSLGAQEVAAGKLNKTLGDTSGEVSKAAQAAKDQAAAMGTSTEKAAQNGTAIDQVNSSTAAFTGTVRDANGALRQYETAADAVKASIDELNGVTNTAAGADLDFRDSLDRITTSMKENGKHLDLNTQKGRDNRRTVLDAVAAAQRSAEAIASQTGSVEAGTAAFNTHIASLRRTLTQSGLTKKQVDALIAAYAKTPDNVSTNVSAPGAKTSKGQIDAHNTAAGRVPGSRRTNVSAPGADLATSKMNAVTRAANNIPPGKTVIVTVRSSGVGTVQREIDAITGHAVSILVGSVVSRTAIQARAAGGPVEEGRLYRVNESGAEGYFVPPKDGFIVNHRDMQTLSAAAPLNARALMPGGRAASGRPQVTITVPITVNPSPGMNEKHLARRVAAEVNATIGGQADRLFRSGVRGD